MTDFVSITVSILVEEDQKAPVLSFLRRQISEKGHKTSSVSVQGHWTDAPGEQLQNDKWNKFVCTHSLITVPIEYSQGNTRILSTIGFVIKMVCFIIYAQAANGPPYLENSIPIRKEDGKCIDKQ